LGRFVGVVMNEYDWLAERFESHRGHLRAVAYRMLGSLAEADDAVQETWLRLSRSDTTEVDNLGGWLTTVTARICLDMLRTRKARGEQPLGIHLPDPIISRADALDPEQQAILADSVGLALLVVLDTLTPAERLTFVLHDMFAVPFEQIATLVGRTPGAAKQLASRARRRVQNGAPPPDPDLAGQRQVVDAFLAAARGGDFDALVAVLDPDVVVRSDAGPQKPGLAVRGAESVARNAIIGGRAAQFATPALVNGVPGIVAMTDGQPFAVMAFIVRGGKIAEIDVLTDPERLGRLDLSGITGR
jgi:RNA polymerase sigma factor (sigma-70 family)